MEALLLEQQLPPIPEDDDLVEQEIEDLGELRLRLLSTMSAHEAQDFLQMRQRHPAPEALAASAAAVRGTIGPAARQPPQPRSAGASPRAAARRHAPGSSPASAPVSAMSPPGPLASERFPSSTSPPGAGRYGGGDTSLSFSREQERRTPSLSPTMMGREDGTPAPMGRALDELLLQPPVAERPTRVLQEAERVLKEPFRLPQGERRESEPERIARAAPPTLPASVSPVLQKAHEMAQQAERAELEERGEYLQDYAQRLSVQLRIYQATYPDLTLGDVGDSTDPAVHSDTAIFMGPLLVEYDRIVSRQKKQIEHYEGAVKSLQAHAAEQAVENGQLHEKLQELFGALQQSQAAEGSHGRPGAHVPQDQINLSVTEWEAFQDEMKLMQEELGTLGFEAKTLKAQLEVAQETGSSTKRELDAARSDCRDKDTQVLELNGLLRELESAGETLHSSRQELRFAIRALEAQNDDIAAKHREANRVLEVTKEELRLAQEALQRTHESEVQGATRAGSQLSELQAKVEALSARNGELEALVDEQKAHLRQDRETVDTASRGAGEANAKVEVLLEERQGLSLRIDQMTAEAVRAQDELSTLRKGRTAEQQAEVATMKEELRVFVERYDRDLDELSRAKAHAEAVAARLQRDVTDLKEQLRLKEESSQHELGCALKAAESVRQALYEANEGLQQAELNQDYAEQQARRFERLYRERADELALLKDVSDKRIQVLEDECAQKQEQAERAELQIGAARRELSARRGSSSEVTDLRHAMEAQQLSTDRRERELLDQLHEAEEKGAQRVAQLEDMVKAAMERAQEWRHESKHIASVLEASTLETRKQMDVLEKENRVFSTSLRQAQAEVQELETENDQLRADVLQALDAAERQEQLAASFLGLSHRTDTTTPSMPQAHVSVR